MTKAAYRCSLNTASCFGYCRRCDLIHTLPVGAAGKYVVDMMERLERLGRLDDTVPAEKADPRLKFSALFDGRRGHMFGAMECRSQEGKTTWIRAFSSLKGGIRWVKDWAPPILPKRLYDDLLVPGEAELVRLTAALEKQPSKDPEYTRLFKIRRALSQRLMAKMHASYRFRSLGGGIGGIDQAFLRDKPPGGVGECCAPRLLQWASMRKLEPVSIAEVYWGGTPPSESRRAGELYPCCESRCQPLMGFMLCGGRYVQSRPASTDDT